MEESYLFPSTVVKVKKVYRFRKLRMLLNRFGFDLPLYECESAAESNKVFKASAILKREGLEVKMVGKHDCKVVKGGEVVHFCPYSDLTEWVLKNYK